MRWQRGSRVKGKGIGLEMILRGVVIHKETNELEKRNSLTMRNSIQNWEVGMDWCGERQADRKVIRC